MKKIFTNQGFTVPELLVSASIFVIILLLTVANLRQGNQTNELRLKGLEVAENIRKVQNSALTALPLSDSSIPDRYGVHFSIDDNKYTIFAETLGSGTDDWLYDAGESVEVINFDSARFVIDGMNDPEVAGCGSKVNNGVMDIVFTVPDAQVYFNGRQPLSKDEPGACGDYNPGWVNLEYLLNGKSVDIMVNWISGQVSVSDILN